MSSQSRARAEGNRQRVYPTSLLIRCTHQEKREIRSRAKRANRSASRFLVELGTGRDDPTDVYLTPEEFGILESLVVQLRRVSSNLSQLACSEDASWSSGAEAGFDCEVRAVLGDVRAVLGELRKRLT